jgi:hypothetical protein
MSAAEQALRDIVALARTDTAWGTASDRFSLRSQIIELATAALGTEPPARGGAPDLHLHDGPLICKVCATPVSGEGVTEDAGATWMHLRCFKPQPGGAGFKCCGAGDPPCTSFEVSCQNPANYADGERWCPKCKQPDFPFCATSGCLKVPKLAEPPQPGGTD